jgi:hypothetical protein
LIEPTSASSYAGSIKPTEGAEMPKAVRYDEYGGVDVLKVV